MNTWADAAGIDPPSKTLDRNAGEGAQPRCCSRQLVAADALVNYGDLPGDLLEKVLDRFPHLASADGAEVYLCDSCRETLRRENVITRAEMPTARPLQVPDAP